jgi:hypothetical protein
MKPAVTASVLGHFGVSMRRSATFRSRRNAIAPAVSHDSSRGSSACRRRRRDTSFRYASSRSRSNFHFGGSCASTTATFGPSPAIVPYERSTLSGPTLSRLMWVMNRLSFTANRKSSGTVARHFSNVVRSGCR